MSVSPDLHVADRQPSNVVDHPKGFAKVMNDVARSGLLNLQQLGLYTLILGYAGPDGECWTDQKTLAKFVGCSVRMLQIHLRELVRNGFIFERPRRESLGETKGRAYSASDAWRRMSHDSHATGVVRVARRNKSYTQPARDSHATGCETHTQPVAALKRPVKRPGEKTAVPAVFRGEEGEADASTAPAAAVVKTIADDDQTTATTSPHATPTAPPPGPRSSPPKSSAAPKTMARSVHRKPRTEPPEAIPIPPALLDWATEQGYTPEIIARETERCLDWHRVEGKPSADWGASLRTWLKHELAYSREDGRALGDHGGRPSRQHADGGGRDYYATRRGRLNEPVVGWPGAPNSQSALDASGDDAWELK
jgi:hypothetical protein